MCKAGATASMSLLVLLVPGEVAAGSFILEHSQHDVHYRYRPISLRDMTLSHLTGILLICIHPTALGLSMSIGNWQNALEAAGRC